MKHGYGIRALAYGLSIVLLLGCLPFASAEDPTAYTGTVLMAVNTNRRDTYANFTTDREETRNSVEAAAVPEQSEDRMLPDAPLDDPQPLSGPQALLRQAEVGDVEPQAAASYRVGDTKQIYSHYAVSEGKEYRRVDMVCTSVSDTVTVWRERGTENDYIEYDERLAAEMDERLPKEREFFGDKRIDTDVDGKMAVFLYKIDGVNIGGYFSVADLMDRVGRVGTVWYPLLSTSNHMDCIHVQGGSSYSFAVETCLHEYQHYIQASYRFVGRNNFNALSATETFINEGFSTAAEYLLFGIDRYSDDFAYAARPSSGLSFMNWRHDNGNYSMAFVFSQYIRTRYAALTDDLGSDIPGGSIYKTVLQARTPKNDDDTLALIADILYPADAYAQLRDSEARCRQLLCDFWLAVFCQEPEGVHGFNGESWASRIKARNLVENMPQGVTEYPIRSGMAAFYRIADNDTDTVRILQSDKTLMFAVPPQQGYTLRFDANGGFDAHPTEILGTSYQILDVPYRIGYTFMGWARTPDASSAQYNTGDRITLTADTTLYAVWQISPTVVTDTSYPMRRQGRENRNGYRFVPETDGVYKLTYAQAYGAGMDLVSMDGEWIDPTYQAEGTGTRSVYYRLTGGTTYILRLEWVRTPSAYASGTFRLTRQDVYYTLTYRFDHPLVDKTWSYTGDTVYAADSLNFDAVAKFMGWTYTPNAQTPDVMPGDELTLTQDTTLYAVCARETSLPTDGSAARDTMDYGAFLYVLQPERDGTYALRWQPDGAAEGESGYSYASLLDAQGESLLAVEPNTAQTCALRGGKTYYLYGVTYASEVLATCKKTSDRITCALTLSVGKKAWLDLTLHGKTTYTVPNYTPAALDGREFLGWEDESRWISYAPGDTITIADDTVLTAQWSRVPEEQNEFARAVLLLPSRVIRALWQNLWLRITDPFTR